jgi:hypothetical protein
VKSVDTPGPADLLACAVYDRNLVVATATSLGRVQVWRWPQILMAFETDCTPNAIAIVPPYGLAIAANEGLMMLGVSGLFTAAPPKPLERPDTL